MNGRLAKFGAALITAACCGCTSRGLMVSSNPPGARVSINHHPAGITPVHVNFTHYGNYMVEVRKDGFDTVQRDENIRPKAWGYDPITFVADNIIPARLNDEVFVHYVLKPTDDQTSRTDLLDRALLARSGEITHARTGLPVKVEYKVDPYMKGLGKGKNKSKPGILPPLNPEPPKPSKPANVTPLKPAAPIKPPRTEKLIDQ